MKKPTKPQPKAPGAVSSQEIREDRPASLSPSKGRLDDISALGTPAQAHIFRLVSPLKASHTESGEEVFPGFYKVYELAPGKNSAHRYLGYTNYALYVLDPLDFELLRVCDIIHVLLITLAPDHSSAILHLIPDLGGDLLINTEESLWQMLESTYYGKRNKYIPCTTAETNRALEELYSKRSKEHLIAYHTSDYQEITRIIIQHGKLGENRLFFRKTSTCTNRYPVLEEGYVIVTTLHIYALKGNFNLSKKTELKDVVEVTVAEDDSCQVVTSSAESRLFYLDRGFTELMKEMMAVKGGKVRVKKKSDIEGYFCKSYRPE